jgi:capsular exopolysaccharide synthesis family protein
VLLVDGDLRKPSLAGRLGIEAAQGTSHLLAGAEPTPHTGLATNLDVLPVGIAPPNPAELLSNGALISSLAPHVDHYDRIIIDTAPIGLVADALLILYGADACILVTRAKQSTKAAVRASCGQLAHLGSALLGTVFNGEIQDGKKGNSYEYGYGYGYGYGGGNAYGSGSDSGRDDLSEGDKALFEQAPNTRRIAKDAGTAGSTGSATSAPEPDQ